MKKLCFHIIVAVMLASCSDNEMSAPQRPSAPGTEVSFALRLSGSDLSTRTVYDDEDESTKSFPVFWVNGDRVAIASPGAAVPQATYSVGIAGDRQNYATSMTKVGDAGIQWGNSFPQNFYSVYPVEYTDVDNSVVKNTFAINGNTATAMLHVRSTQRQVFECTTTTDGERILNIWKGTPVDENGMTYPDAIMYAQKQMNADGAVVLQYIPFTTAFNITIDGYELTAGFDDPHIVIQEIIIEAPEGVQLAGDFTATFNEDATTPPVVDVTGNSCAEPNVIRIPCMTSDVNYLHPAPSTDASRDIINVNVFAIPIAGKVTADWKLHVKTNYRTYTRSLKPAASDGAGMLVPGQVHKMEMPNIFITLPGETTLDPSTWMQKIPRNVYITDLSLPGAWYSRQKEYQGTNNGAEWTIRDLWNKGVRAFSVETRTSTLARYPYDPNAVVVSGTGRNGGLGSNKYYTGGTPIADVMGSLCDAVSEKRFGYALLMLSYADGGEGGHRPKDYAYWLQGIYEAYNGLSTERKAAIHADAISPRTTIEDVAGKVVLMVNVASGLPGGDITAGDYNCKLPALFTYVNRKRTPGTAPVSMMHWMDWQDSYMKNVDILVHDNDNVDEARDALSTLEADYLYCNYSIANRTQPDGGSDADLPTYAQRKTALGRILRNSSLSLELGCHNLLSVFAAGGTEAASATSGTNTENFAANMNQWILDRLDERIRTENYGPFGNVFCSYIANKAGSVDGAKIIERILRMNQLFRLSRDESKPEIKGVKGTRTLPPAANSGGQNGWSSY